MTHFIGIDPSLTSTGIAVVDGAGECLHLDTIKTGKLRGVPRLQALRFGVKRVLARHPNPEALAVEGYSMGSRGRTHDIGEWGGLIRLMMYEAGLTLYVAPPNNLKQFATGKGNSGKPAVILAAYKTFGLDLSGSDDQADAIWLAHLARHMVMGDTGAPKLTKLQKNGLSKVQLLPTHSPRS